MFRASIPCILILAAATAVPLFNQSITGSIGGSVVDPSGLPVAAAPVSLRHLATGLVRDSKTSERGDFRFESLQPGQYTLAVAVEGFKRQERSNITLPASERLSLGEIVLEVGAVADTITVTSEGAQVQTASAERAGLITSDQVDGLLVRGRNVMSLLQLLPGVVDLQENESIVRNFTVHAQGGRIGSNTITLDGVSINNTSNGRNANVMPGQDAVMEVKVLLSNYQAEYGRKSGATVAMITKSGTREFHGLGSYFKRHEQFNANDFFNNRNGLPKPRYRFNTWNYNVGGPVYVPGKFNASRDKLFFFWSQEIWPITVPRGQGQITVPTALERAGDFSQTLDLNGRLVAVTDPLDGRAFPGNVIPASRIDSNGQALLKFLPEPNFLDTSISGRRYNHIFQQSVEQPQRNSTLKVDYNLTSKHLFAATLTRYVDTFRGAVGLAASGRSNWPQMGVEDRDKGASLSARYQAILSPTLVNEFTFGFNRKDTSLTPLEGQLERNQRDRIGFRSGQLHPDVNPQNVIPNLTFGGVTGAIGVFIEGRFPKFSLDDYYSISNNLSKTWGSHSFKAGIFTDSIFRDGRTSTTFNGNLDFSRDRNNPLDTNYAFSNAVMGNFRSYSESSGRPVALERMRAVDWYAQDNWRVTRRLTLDYGLRFGYQTAPHDAGKRVAGFVAGRFDPAREVELIAPALVNRVRSGVHPLTGQVYPASAIGALAPGVGDAANGMVITSENGDYPVGLADAPGLRLGPRFGFAYDPWGNGDTAIRGGFGMFYDRQDGFGDWVAQPPLVQTPTIFYGTLATLRGSGGLLFPQNVSSLDRNSGVAQTMNFSLAVQRKVLPGTVLDVGYVGSLGRHLVWNRDLNAIPLGANFAPANADPSSPGVPLPASFLRPYRGYETIAFQEWGASSNYHSMQVALNRRYTRGLQTGVSWTWSKAMDYGSRDQDFVTSLVSARVWNYGLSTFDRTHVFKFNWLWDVPKLGTSSPVLARIVNGWQYSGIASFISGSPLGVGFSTTTATDITGTPSLGPRIDVTGNPVLPKGERTFSRFFDASVFALPARGTIGTAARTVLRGPGANNWDMAIFKNFPLREKIRLQFRAEMYNAFNHTQWASVDTAARFDPQGQQVNARLGEVRSTRLPRIVQFALRFYF